MPDHPLPPSSGTNPRMQAPAILDERAMESIRFRARSLAALDSRITKINDPAERAMAAVGLAITLDSLGLSIDPIQARKLHLISGDWTPSAQLMVELVQRRGHEIVPVTMTRDRAIFRGRRFGQGEPITVEYSIEDARESGALDEWVEEWKKTSNNKSYCVRFVVAVDGVPTTETVPDWAKALVDQRKVKRNDAWFKFRIDMLANRCVKRLTKWMAADALNGYGPVVEAEPGWRDDVVADAEVLEEGVISTEPEDDITEAEVVTADTPAVDDVTDGFGDEPEDAKKVEAVEQPEETFAPPPVPRTNPVSQQWIDEVLTNCADHVPEGVRPGALAAALVRRISKGERSELCTVNRGSEQSALRDRFIEFTNGRLTLAIDEAGVATLVEASKAEA